MGRPDLQAVVRGQHSTARQHRLSKTESCLNEALEGIVIIEKEKVIPARAEERVRVKEIVCDICQRPKWATCMICERDICPQCAVEDPDSTGDYPNHICTTCMGLYDKYHGTIEREQERFDAFQDKVIDLWRSESLDSDKSVQNF